MFHKVSACAAMLLFGLSNASANLITNGDFESGDLSGWTSFTTASGTISGVPGAPGVASFATNGTPSLASRFSVGQVFFNYSSAAQGGGIFQNFLTGAGSIAISADVATHNFGQWTNADAGIFSLVLDSVEVASVDLGEILAGEIDRALLSYTGTIDAGSHELRILMKRPWAVPPNLFQYVDNVDVRVASVPEPATLALLGLGLLGVAAARRAKH